MLKREQKAILAAIGNLERGLRFLNDEKIAVMKRIEYATTTDIFQAPFYPGQYYRSVAKDIGSGRRNYDDLNCNFRSGR